MKKHGFIKENNSTYTLTRAIEDEDILAAAREILQRRFRRGTCISSPGDMKGYLISQIAHLPSEVFYMVFLDNRHRILASEILFQGTIDGASVYVRECVKRVFELNAAACILSHQHPSGVTSPSQADKNITQRLKDALALIDVRVLDHIIIGGTDSYSFAENGLL